MAELRESSLMFSLDALLAHERDKVEAERRATLERERAAVDAQVAAERARLVEEARIIAERRERTLAEERRFLDEQARLEGIRQAELERVRLETARKSDAELSARRARHELELRALAENGRIKKLRAVSLGVGVVAGLAACGAVAFALWGGRPELERLRAAAAAARAAETAQANELRAMLDDAARRQRTLEAQVAARADDAVASPSASGTAPARPSRPVHGVRPVGTSPHGVSRPRTPCTGDEHDPLNPCLGG